MSVQVPPVVAAEMLGWTTSMVYAALQYGKVEWGECFKRGTNRTYLIYSHKLAEYCNIPESHIVSRVERRRLGFKRKRKSSSP